MRNKIIVDCGFGDSSKGNFTDYLCSKNSNSLVIRFNGAGQAGHTVVLDGKRHVFSNFGSGSLRGVPTYWSNFCAIHPTGIVNEYKALKKIGCRPILYVDDLCPVTTPYDIFHNHEQERVNGHGSVGVGFGATMARHNGTYKLFAKDLKYPKVLKLKLAAIADFYDIELSKEEEEDFLKDVEETLDIVTFVTESTMLQNRGRGRDCNIFEGAQGVLLDMDHGFFPHVTYSNTTSKNAVELINRNALGHFDTFYLTRAYQTRHGNGPMTNEEIPLNVKDNPLETNVSNRWQGHFRKSVLDIDLLRYSINTDANYSGYESKNLVISCLDQIEGKIQYTLGGKLFETDNINHLAELILPNRIGLYLSKSPESKDII